MGVFIDSGIISVLLVIAHLLRARVRWLQDIYLPTPIIAGVFGLLLSEQALGLLPFSHTPSGAVAMASYPFQLVILLFATLFMGARPKQPALGTVVRTVGNTFFFNLASEVGQFGVALCSGSWCSRRSSPSWTLASR